MASFAKAHFEIVAEVSQHEKKDAAEPSENPAAAASTKVTYGKAKSIPGKPVSGRVWKLEPKKASSVRVGKAWHSTWEEKQEERNRKRAIKEREKALKDEVEKEKEAEKKRREERKKRKLENEKKSEVVQPVTNTKKIKKMSKKQLLQLRKV